MKTASILVIERDQFQNDIYVKSLASEGYDIYSALDGESALKIIKDGFMPDIIFLDLRLPDIDGMIFLKKYQPSNHPHTTVVVFSDYDSHTGVDQAYQLGVQRYILKSHASPRELIRIVSSVMSEKYL